MGNRIHFDRPDNETQWYKFTLASDGILTMNMLTYSSDAVNYVLYNEELTSDYEIDDNELQLGSETSPKDLKIGQKIVGIVSKVNKQNWFRFTVKKKTILQFKAKTFCKEFFTYDFKNADG